MVSVVEGGATFVAPALGGIFVRRHGERYINEEFLEANTFW